MRDQVAEQGPVAEAAREDVGDQFSGAPFGGIVCGGAFGGRALGGRVEFVVQGLCPVAPGLGGQFQEDLLAGLEVAQQGRLVHADLPGDVGQAHVADAVPQRQVAGRAEDGVLAPQLLLGAAGRWKVSAGHQLVATARQPGQLAGLADRYGRRILPVTLDVTDPEAAAAAVAAGIEAFGRLDVVVNNAGYANLAAVEDITLADFRAQVEANLVGVVNVTKAALPVLRAQGGGHIIQVSSIGGRLATAGLSAYQTAKWAVGGFSEVLAREVGPLGVKVTVLEPGGMKTDWAGSSMQVPPISEPYQPTVGVAARVHHDLGSSDALGDPAKVAQVVLAVAAMDEPPLRLILGSEAYAYATAAARARAESDAAWRDLTSSTDRDDATAAQRDPLGAARA